MIQLRPDVEATPRFRWQRWAIAGLVVVTLYAALWLYPHHEITFEHARASACLELIDRTGVGDPRACTPHTPLASSLPWTSQDADAADLTPRVARKELQLAMTRDLDRAKRDRALREATRHALRPEGMWWEAAAFDAMIAHANQLGDGVALRRAVLAALWTADTAGLHALAKLEPRTDPLAFDLIRARIQCLFADATTHDTLLAAATAVERFGGPSHDLDHAAVARVAALCDPTLSDITDGKLSEERWLQTVAGRPAHPLDLHDAELTKRWQGIAALVTFHLLGDTDPTHYAIHVNSAKDAATPWQILGASGLDELPTAAAKEDDTARFLVTLADAAKAPQATQLRRNVYQLALDAAAAWAHRGELGRARASVAIAAAAAHHPDLASEQAADRRGLVPYMQLVGDLDGALAEAEAGPNPDDNLERALVLIATGKLGDAFDALAASHDSVDAAWLRAALAVRLGRDITDHLPPYIDHHSATAMTYYYEGARANAAEQAVRRMASLPPFERAAVLPEALYLVGALAGKGDVELWLDYASAKRLEDRGVDPILYTAARAEAARWRGDTTAANTWDDRTAKLRALATDDRAGFLVHTLDGSAD